MKEESDPAAGHHARPRQTMADVLQGLALGCEGPNDAPFQALLAVLGSGPAVAVLDSMIAANQANSLMYASSVAQQQRTNVLGMVAMTKCVARLLEGPGSRGTLDIDTDLDVLRE